MGAHSENSRRIVKNTLMLYVRMLVLMLIGFYTSRVVLGALGESDYGVYNVIGGVVAMFTVISGALNSAISRFITFELGKDDGNGEDKSISRASQLNKVYSTAVLIQAAIALIVAAVAEPVGIWFINNEMTIAPDRIPAATWVLHFSVLSFVINLLSVPQMASITAHERMSAYAYIGLLDGFLRLMVAFLILRAPFDRLISYAALMAVVVLIVRIAYGVYCRRNFEECHFRPVFDAKLVREMFSFAGWNFIGVSSGVLRDHGGNILVNLFFGPAMNAARGVAMQVFTALQGFVTNFMTAVNPQITKSYAAGDYDYLFALIRKSSKMSFYLLFVIALPVLFNTEYLLGIWLKDVPQGTVLFAQLFLIFALSESLSNPMITAMLATGRIRNYQIIVGGIQLMNVPVSYVLLKAGASAQSTVAVAIMISQICFFVRLYLLKRETGYEAVEHIKKVYFNVLMVSAVALVLPLAVSGLTAASPADTAAGAFARFLLSAAVAVLSAGVSVLYIGCTKDERQDIYTYLRKLIRK